MHTEFVEEWILNKKYKTKQNIEWVFNNQRVTGNVYELHARRSHCQSDCEMYVRDKTAGNNTKLRDQDDRGR